MSASHPASDDGSALVMVLAFVLVTSVIIGALLDRSYTTFRAARVTSVLTERVLAANGGVDWGIQQVRSHAIVDGAPACVSPRVGTPDATRGGTPFQVLTDSLVLNGRTVTVRCAVESGYGVGAGGWAAYLRDGSAGALTVYAGTDADKVVAGPVYNAGTFTRIGEPKLRLFEGDLWSCTGAPDLSWVVPATAPYTVNDSCGPATVPEPPIPVDQLAVSPASLRNASPQPPAGDGGTAGCRVFEPGRYAGTGFEFLAAADGANYLKSGVYLLDDLGTLRLDDITLVGGIPAPRDEPFNDAREGGCGGDFESPEATGGHYGVLLVLGGSTRIEIGSGSTVELFNYVEPTLASSGGMSVLQLTETAAASTVTGGANDTILSTAVGSAADLVLHGTVYTPRARVSAFGTTESRASLLGGVVAAALDLQAGAHRGGTHVGVLDGPGSRTIRIVATTNRADGEKKIEAEAVVDVANDASRTATVTSWTVTQ